MKLRIVALLIVVVVAALAFAAWKREPVQSAAPPADASGQTESGEAGQMPPGAMPAPPAARDPGVSWTVPKRWLAQMTDNGMRLATYIVPGAAQDADGECAVYYFGPGQGGSVQENLARWVGEFREPGKHDMTTRTVAGCKISMVDVGGIYIAHGMKPGESSGEKPGWALRGAIVEGPAGAVFFKLTGPEKTVARAAGEFDGMLGTIARK